MVSTIFCWPDPNLCWLSEVTTFRRLNPIKISMLLKSHSLWLNHHFLLQKLVKCRCITIPKCLDFLGFPSSEAQPSNHRLPGGHGIFGATGAGLCRCGTVVTGAALRSWGAWERIDKTHGMMGISWDKI